MHAGAGHYHVTYAGETRKCLGTGAHLHSEPGHFCYSSCDHGSSGIVSISQPVYDTGADSHYVFDGPCKLHAQHIFIYVYPEFIGGKEICDSVSRGVAFRGNGHYGRNSEAYFLRMRGTRDANISIHIQADFLCDLGHPEQSFLLYALGYIHHVRIAFDIWRCRRCGLSEDLSGKREHDIIRILNRSFIIEYIDSAAFCCHYGRKCGPKTSASDKCNCFHNRSISLSHYDICMRPHV